jgi:amino acid transporter
MVIGYGTKHITALATSTAPMSFLAQHYLGKGYAVAVDLAGISALIAVLIAAHTANFRVLYVMGRERVLPEALGRLSRYKTPYVAVFVYAALSILITLVAGGIWGPFGAFGNLGFWASLGVMPIYLMVCIALWRYTRRNGTFSWFKYGVIPFVTLVFYIFPIITSLYPYPGMPLAAMPFMTLAWAGIGFLVIYRLGRQNPQALEVIGKTVFEDDTPDLAVPAGSEVSG